MIVKLERLRVGARMMAYGPSPSTKSSASLCFFGTVVIHTRSGIKNAAVFPDPVLKNGSKNFNCRFHFYTSATPIMSRFCSPIGIACL